MKDKNQNNEKGTGIKNLYPYLIPVLVLVAWFAVIYRWTAGFSGFTTYSYAMAKAGPLPRPIPEIPLVDFHGKAASLSAEKGKYILVDFMYLHCSYVCGLLRSQLLEYYPELNGHLHNKLIFFSISFDPQRDTPELLNETWLSMGSPENWKFATINGSYEQISKYLKQTGIVRLKLANGDFNHTALFYLIDPNGNLIATISPAKKKKDNIETIKEYIKKDY